MPQEAIQPNLAETYTINKTVLILKYQLLGLILFHILPKLETKPQEDPLKSREL